MNQSKRERLCKCCGHVDVEYRHNLRAFQVRALQSCFKAAGRTPFKPSLVNQLDHSQKCNFATLKYWGFVEKCRIPDKKAELWRITDLGQAFLQGQASAPKFLWSWRGELAKEQPNEAKPGMVKFYQVLGLDEPPTRQGFAAAARIPTNEAQQNLL